MGRRGFTLRELVVAVGLLAVLGGMALAALDGAGEAAGQAACLERQHQLALGCALYAIDHDDVLPTNGPGGLCNPPGSGGTVYPANFAFAGLPGRDPQHDDGRTGGDVPYSSVGHWCNKIYEYVPDPETYLCEVREELVGPMHGPGELWDLPGWWIGSVACEYGFVRDRSWGNWVRQSELTHPADTILIAHANRGNRALPMLTKRCATDGSMGQWPAIYPHFWAGEAPGGRNGFIFGDYSVRLLTLQEVQAGAESLFQK